MSATASQGREQYRKKWHIENDKVESHGEEDGEDQRGIRPQRKCQQAFILAQTSREGLATRTQWVVPVHGVEHFNRDQDGEGHGRGLLCGMTGKHVTSDLGKVALAGAIMHLHDITGPPCHAG